MRFIDARAVAAAADVPEWIAAMERALRAGQAGGAVMPQRMHLDRGENTFLLMPCVTEEYWATKLVSFCPANTASGLPSIHGTIVLARARTGEPLAVLEGAAVTALRTAAISALAIRHLAPEGAERLGIVGTGAQAVQQARFACAVRRIREIIVCDVSESAVSRFIESFGAYLPHLPVRVARGSGQLCRDSDIVITATNSREPVFPEDPALFEGRTFVGIGSYKPDCREYPDAFFKHVDQVFVDTLHGKSESGDLIYPIRAGLIAERSIHPLGRLITGEVALSRRPTRFCKTVGSALFDAYGAQLIYEKTSA